MARQLRQGQFIGYVGRFAYLVDAFATSTPWEYDLFATDDALLGAKADAGSITLHTDNGTLNDIWTTNPTTPRPAPVALRQEEKQ
jgi:hypothetical protein